MVFGSKKCKYCEKGSPKPGFDYCSRECGRAAQERKRAQEAAEKDDLCIVCKKNPKWCEYDKYDQKKMRRHDFCSSVCRDIYERRSRGSSSGGGASYPRPPRPTPRLELMAPGRLRESVCARFSTRWTGPKSKKPKIVQVYRVRTIPPYSLRFQTALELNPRAKILTVYWAGSCTCDITLYPDSPARACQFKDCTVCQVLEEPFRVPMEGSLGPGVYTSLDPLDAHELTNEPRRGNCRAVLQCRLVYPSRDDSKPEYAVQQDSNGKIFSTKSAIIPTHLILYVPQPSSRS